MVAVVVVAVVVGVAVVVVGESRLTPAMTVEGYKKPLVLSLRLIAAADCNPT